MENTEKPHYSIQEGTSPDPKAKNFRTKCAFLWHFLIHEAVMEPFLLMVMFGYMVRSVTTADLFKDKACLVELQLNESVCNNIKNYTDEENEVQRIANNYHVYQTILSMGPAIMATILFGAWSDTYGRKIPIMIASGGLIIELFGLTFNYVGFEAPIYWMVVCAVPVGISGGLMVIMLSAISYVTDITTTETRSIRFAMLELSFIVGAPVGQAVGGIIQKNHGYMAVFITSIAFQCVAFIYLAFRLKEPKKKKITNYCQAVRDLFSIENVKNNIKSCTKPREGTIRREIWMIFAAMFGYIFCAMGTMTMTYYYTVKMYKWDNYHYSMVGMIFSIAQGILILITVPLMTKVFKMKDMSMALIGVLSLLACTLLKGLAFKESLYYLGCLLGLLSGISNIGARTKLSKLVSKDEVGKVFSVLSLTESLVPLIGTALFGSIYSASVSFYPGLTYIIAACFLSVPIPVYMFLYKWGNKPTTYVSMQETEPEIKENGMELANESEG